MYSRVLIFSGGCLDTEFAKDYLANEKFDLVICADSGLDAAYRLGVKADYIVGDFDSLSENAIERYRNDDIRKSKEVKVIKFPPEKDSTDTDIALEYAMEQKPDEIVILGATGGRMDHFLANVNILMKPLKYGIPTYIVDKYNKIYLIDKDTVIKRKSLWGKYISFQPLTEIVKNVRLSGLKYILDGEDLTIGKSLTVSNEMADGTDEAMISFDTGVIIVIEARDA